MSHNEGEVEEVKSSEKLANGPEKLELLHDGHYYDVTSFVDRHPGGPIIKMYLNNGEDATQAIQQFHARSSKRIDAILRQFPRRIATEDDLLRSWGSARLEKNKALSHDFSALYKELVDEGLFEPSPRHVWARYLEIAMIGILGISLFSRGWSVIGWCLISWAAGRSTWFVHEAGHHSLTGNPGFDRWLQSHIYGIYCGLSGARWRNHHSQHHAMPQHITNDVDLQTLPLFAFHERVVKNPGQYGLLVKYQKYFIYCVQSSIMGFYWKWVEDPTFAWKHGHYWDLIHMGIHQVFVFFLGLPLYILSGIVVLSYMVLQATLSHTHLPITEPENNTHWVEYALVHTANVRSSWWVDYFMGYLNYQIEHHLFPTMPQFRNKLASKRVKALAAKHGLPYHLYDYKSIVIKTVQNLANVSASVEKKFELNSKEQIEQSDENNNNYNLEEVALDETNNGGGEETGFELLKRFRLKSKVFLASNVDVVEDIKTLKIR